MRASLIINVCAALLLLAVGYAIGISSIHGLDYVASLHTVTSNH